MEAKITQLFAICSATVSPGARFSKVPKLFGRITGNIILIVSSKQMRLET